MATKKSEAGAAPQKAKVRVFFAEVEGDSDSIKEALKTMAQAMNQPAVQVAPAQARVPGNGSTSALLAAPAYEEPAVEAEVAGNEEAQEAAPAPETPKRMRRTGQKRDYNAGIELIPNMDFRPNGKQALTDFFADKAPKGDMEQILVLAYYMQHTMTLATIGPNHVRTAYKAVSKPLPVDLRQTMRNMKTQKIWLSFTSLDEIQVTTQGENFVEHDMEERKSK